jgi:hypothetical protein
MKWVCAALLAVSMCVCSTSVALAADAGVAVTPQSSVQVRDAAADMHAWLSEVAVWSQGYDALTTSRVETLGWLLDSAEVLVQKLDVGTGAAQKWADDWAPEARARLASEMAAYQALSTSMPTFPASLPRTPDMQTRLLTASRTSDLIGTLMITTSIACENYITAIQAAASGKESDYAKIDPARLGLMISQLQAENTMVASAVGENKGPSQQLARVQILSNNAILVWLEHNKQAFGHQQVDGAASGKLMRQHINDMREGLVVLDREVDEISVRISSQSDLEGTPFARLIDNLVISYRDSSRVEVQMADALMRLAEAVESGDPDADDPVSEQVAAIADRRLALHEARLALIAAGGQAQ